MQQKGAQPVQHESYHSLQFWAEMIIQFRSSAGNPLPRCMIGQLRHHVMERLYRDWMIDMRYAAITLSEQNALCVYNDSVWVRLAWQQLGR